MHKSKRFTILISALLIISLSAVFISAGEISPQLQKVLDTSKAKEEIAVIVQLKDQVNRKQFKKFKKKLRRFKLLKELKKQANVNQASIRSYLMNSGGKNMRSLWIINGLAVKAKPSVIRKLAKRQEVMEVRLDSAVSLEVDAGSAIADSIWNLTMLNAELAWEQGFQGQGVVIASMDSGVDYKHSALAGNWRGGTNSWFVPYDPTFDPYDPTSVPYDSSGHGTQTMGIMVGQSLGDMTIGMAPQAQWIAVKIFDNSGNALTSVIHAGFQWLLDPDGDPNTDDAPDIVNNSWGFPQTIGTCYTEFQQDIQTLRDLDINVVFSAGNQGGGSSSISPANNLGGFAVGAVNQSEVITSFSNQGPSACGQDIIYPRVVAPGYLVSTTDLTFGGLFPNATMLVSGTSFAAPHVSGAMALLLSSNPDLEPVDLETAIVQSATDLGDVAEDNVYGYGLVNVGDALAYLTPVSQCVDADGDGFFSNPSCGTPIDCDDSNSVVFPNASEVVHDGIDQNCNGYDLTIDITRAVYKTALDKLIIVAKSSLAHEANLKIEVHGTRPRPMKWNGSKQQWQRVFYEVSSKGKRWQLNSGTVVSVSGPEGRLTIPLTIRK